MILIAMRTVFVMTLCVHISVRQVEKQTATRHLKSTRQSTTSGVLVPHSYITIVAIEVTHIIICEISVPLANSCIQ